MGGRNTESDPYPSCLRIIPTPWSRALPLTHSHLHPTNTSINLDDRGYEWQRGEFELIRRLVEVALLCDVDTSLAPVVGYHGTFSITHDIHQV